MRTPVLIAAAMWLAAIASPGRALAQRDSPSSRTTLAALPGFFVSVEEMDTAAARVGVTAAVIQADVESKLRSKGIRLYNEDDFKHVLDVPQLYVNINELALHGTQAGLFTYNATTEVRQAIQLTRNPSIATTSVTWRAPATVGTVGADNFYTAVRDVVREQVDLLLEAYHAANPSP
jgi:hypothetical protein